jgi:hypothetical protein
MDADAAERRLLAFPGVGIWTARSAYARHGATPTRCRSAIPPPEDRRVHLTGETRSDDARMLELLEPWRGQRGRIVRWILSAGRMPPRRGPRLAMRDVVPPVARWCAGCAEAMGTHERLRHDDQRCRWRFMHSSAPSGSATPGSRFPKPCTTAC